MSKKKTPIESGKPGDPITVKLDRELMRKANAVADFRSLNRQAYLESMLRPLIEADYREFLRQESGQSNTQGGGK